MFTDTDSYMRRDYDTYRDDSEPVINVKFGMKIHNFHWSVSNNYVTLWAVSENHAVSDDYTKGFAFTMEVRDLFCYFRAWAVDAGLLKDSLMYGPQIVSGELIETKYFDLTMNMETFAVTCNVYEDFDMTILNGTWTDTFTGGPAWAGGSWLTYEYVNARFIPAGPNTGYSGAHLSMTEELETSVYAYDPDIDTIYNVTDLDDDGDIDKDDAELFIEDIVSHPEDPAPGITWGDFETGPFTRFRMRLYFLFMGISMIFGPMMVFAYRRPSGYEFVIGLFIMFVGFAFLLSVGSV